MLRFKRLSTSFWAEAVATSVYVKNRLSAKPLGDLSPEEAWSGTKPDVSHLKVFGCKAFVFVDKQKRHKWDSTSRECIFIGYQDTVRNYKFYDPKRRCILISPHAKFDEIDAPECNEKPKENGDASSIELFEQENEDQANQEESEADQEEPKTPERN